MRLLLMPSSYVPVLGGLQTVAHTLAQHLLRRGHEVRVVSNRYPRSLLPQERLDGVPVRRLTFLTPRWRHLRSGRPDLFLAGLYVYPVTFWRLKKMVHSFRPDVVNVHFPDAQIPFVLGLRHRFDFRLVVSLHGHEVLRHFEFGGGGRDDGRLSAGNSPGLEQLRAILRAADAVTACSRYLLEHAARIEPTVMKLGEVIHNGIDLARFEDETVHPHPRPYVLAYGRLTHKKGFDLLLRAFAEVAPSPPQVDLIIAGEGEEREELEALAARLGLRSRVAFYGRAAPGEVVALLNGACFVVVPSRREPFGIVALEAMAAGKPVLATRVGGLPEFVDNSCDRLVEPTVEGLARGLQDRLGEENKAPRRPRGRDALSGLSWKTAVDAYEAVFVEALRGHREAC